LERVINKEISWRHKMAENYMKQYIELSTEFKKDKKSQETIGRIYDLMYLLEKDENTDNKMVLVYVYTLLAYHKKAYDLYLKIYNENDRKQKTKLFEMEQMAKSHGDNFIIRLRTSQKNEKLNFTINDFTEKETDDNWNNYESNKNCIIFNQTFDNEPLEISIHKNNKLSDCVEKISEYINWLGTECKKELIKYYNKNMEQDEKADNDWYENLEIISVLITIGEEGKISADISCGDNYFEDHILDIETEGNNIFSMNYDG
jgi:hypothetical protein